MGRLAHFSERDLDRILDGQAPADDAAAEALARFAREARGISGSPALHVEDRHLAAIAQATRLLADKGEPVVRPASKAQGPARQVSGLPKRRRVRVLSTLFATLTAKIAAVSVAALAATGGLAATGNLPGSAQEAVSSALSQVGIDVPDGQDEESDTPPEGEGSENASDTAEAVQAVIDGWQVGERGCEFGRAVAAAAGGQTGKAAECPATGEERAEAGKAKGADAAASGKSKGADAAESGKAKGADAADSGKAKGADAAESGKANADNADTGRGQGDTAQTEAEETAGSGKTTGSDAAESGPANAEGAPSGPPDSVPSGRP